MISNSKNTETDHQIESPMIDYHNIVSSPSSIYNSTEFPAAAEVDSENHSEPLSSSSSSSIGENSDKSDGDEEEVQSEYKGGPLDSLDALEEVLPVKKSLSTFYCGKSKSFTSLSDAVSFPSIQDITKPENEYTRKRKNLLAFNNFLDKNRNNMLQRSKGGMMKRATNSRSMMTLAATMNCSETNSGETSNSNSSSSGCTLPPLPPHMRKALHHEVSLSRPTNECSSWRSFSLADLQAAEEASCGSVNCDK